MNRKAFKFITVILVLIVLPGAFSGCSEKFRAGDTGYQSYTTSLIQIAVRSDSDEFKSDFVEFDLEYGFYDIDTAKKRKGDINGYRQYSDDKTVFAIYVCDSENLLPDLIGEYLPDYKNVGSNIFIRDISEEEAFEEFEYGYTWSFFGGVKYNHRENIKIPSEVLQEAEGEFCIVIVSYICPRAESGDYFALHEHYITLGYEKIDENKVKIKF